MIPAYWTWFEELFSVRIEHAAPIREIVPLYFGLMLNELTAHTANDQTLFQDHQLPDSSAFPALDLGSLARERTVCRTGPAGVAFRHEAASQPLMEPKPDARPGGAGEKTGWNWLRPWLRQLK
jgi:hypothetical protein